MATGRQTTWIDPLPESAVATRSGTTAPVWFVLGGVAIVAAGAIALAARALRLAGRRES